MINKIIKEKRADAVGLGLMLSLMIIFMAVGCILYIMPVFDKQLRLQSFTKQLLRECEIMGSVDQVTYINNLKNATGLHPEISFEYEGYKGTKKVQLNGNIKVICKDKYPFVIRQFINIEIPLKCIQLGKSEVYYK